VCSSDLWNEEEKYMEFMENRYSRYDD
jgi:hypothetical protein